MIQLSNLQNKKIAILGFGIEGKATAEYLIKNVLNFTICDQLSREEFLSKNPDYSEYKLRLGDEYLSGLNDFDYIFKTPGISPLINEIQDAIASGTVISSQIELFLTMSPTKNIVGVTGTKGKGTTSTLIYEMLNRSYGKAYLGGNIGIPAISFIDELNPDSWVVLELSSFQLQSLSQSPHIAVLLNITSEHLDYHKDTQEYRDSKANIVKFQKDNDFAIINADYEVPMGYSNLGQARKYYFSRFKEVNGCYVDSSDQVVLSNSDNIKKLVNFKELQLRGRHNLENVTAASLAASLADVAPSDISAVLRSFKGLEHRLELVSEVNGVKYYDDSFSTVPETAIAALDSFSEPIILIAGGSSKNSDYTEFGRKIAQSNLKKLILIGDTTEDILNSIPKRQNKFKIVTGLTSMADIVKEARIDAVDGDVVLLSPACASFGLFKNYKDRGDQFKAVVKSLN